MTLALIIDVGTSNVKVGVVNPEGAIIERAAREITPSRPEQGAVEHDPEALLQLIGELSREVAAPHRESIVVLGFSGYQFGFLPMDEAGKPLTGIMTLLDGRSRQTIDRMQSEFPVEEIYRRTGCPPLFNYSLAKLFWLKTQRPELFARTRRIADLKSFLLESYTGRFATEPSTASATQLLNIRTADWDDDILERIGIDRSYLPEVVPGEEILGTITPEGAEMLGLSPRTAVFPGVYDGGAMVIGMGGYSEDVAACNLGTTAMLRGCASSPLLDDPSAMRLQTYALMKDLWMIGGALNNAGIALSWYRDTLASSCSYDEITARAGVIAAGSEGLFFLPFLTGERDPRIGNAASASYIGLRQVHTAGHMSRAILEGVCYTLRMLRDACTENDFRPNRLRIGGSGSTSDLWVQIMADVLAMPVERTRTSDAALVGEGMMGFAALGQYRDLHEAGEAMIELGDVFHPSEAAVATYETGYEFFSHLVETMGSVYPRHAERYL